MPVPQECVVEIDIIAFSNICFSGVLTVAGYEICTTFRPCILNANMHQSKVCNLGTLGKIWLCVLAYLLVHKVILTQRTPPLPVPDSTTEPKRGEYMHSAIIPKDWKVGIASQNNLLICSPIITA